MRKPISIVAMMVMVMCSGLAMAGTPGWCPDPHEYDPFHCLMDFNPDWEMYSPDYKPIWPAEMGEFTDGSYTNWRWYTRADVESGGLGSNMYDPDTQLGWNAWLPDDPNCDQNPETNPAGCPGGEVFFDWSVVGNNPGNDSQFTPRREEIPAGYDFHYVWLNFRRYEDGTQKARLEFNINKQPAGFRVTVPVMMWSQWEGVWGIVGNVGEGGVLNHTTVLEQFEGEGSVAITPADVKSVDLYLGETLLKHYDGCTSENIDTFKTSNYDTDKGVWWPNNTNHNYGVLEIEPMEWTPVPGTYKVIVTMQNDDTASREFVINDVPEMPMPTSVIRKTKITKKGKVVETGAIQETLFVEELNGSLLVTWNEPAFILPGTFSVDSRVQIFAGQLDPDIELYTNAQQPIHMGMAIIHPEIVELLRPYGTVKVRVEYRYKEADFQYRPTTLMVDYTFTE